MDGGFGGGDDIGKERGRKKKGKHSRGGRPRCLTNLKVMRQFIT